MPERGVESSQGKLIGISQRRVQHVVGELFIGKRRLKRKGEEKERWGERQHTQFLKRDPLLHISIGARIRTRAKLKAASSVEDEIPRTPTYAMSLIDPGRVAF